MSLLWLFPLLASSALIEFDESDPIASHPDMKNLVHHLVDRRRGLDTLYNTFSNADRQQILDTHNRLRAEVARGEYQAKTRLPAACDMNELKYSLALESVAMGWSQNNCSPIGGPGRQPHNQNCERELVEAYPTSGDNWPNPPSLDGLIFVGENIMFDLDDIGGREPGHWLDTTEMDKIVEVDWGRNEAKKYSYGDSFTYDTGHFREVISAHAEYVGCGFCAGRTNGFCPCSNGMYKFTCNYFPGSSTSGNPYTRGTACSCCPDGREFCSTGDIAGLCNDQVKSPTYASTTTTTTLSPTQAPLVIVDPSCVTVDSLHDDFDFTYVRNGQFHEGRPVYEHTCVMGGIQTQDCYVLHTSDAYQREEDGHKWIITNWPQEGYTVGAYCLEEDVLDCGWNALDWSTFKWVDCTDCTVDGCAAPPTASTPSPTDVTPAPQAIVETDPECVKVTGVHGMIDGLFVLTSENGKPIYKGGWYVFLTAIWRNEDDTEWLLGPNFNGYFPSYFCQSENLLNCGWISVWTRFPGADSTKIAVGTTIESDGCVSSGFTNEQVENDDGKEWIGVYVLIALGALMLVIGNIAFCFYIKRRKKVMVPVMTENQVIEMEEDVNMTR